MPRNEKIGIVGSGFIGRSWAMLYAGVGYQVCLYDVKEEQVSSAMKEIKKQLKTLETSGMLRGSLSADEQFKCISTASSMRECIKGAKYVQESVFEDLELKTKVFREMDEFADANTVLASSVSCIVPSKFTANLAHKENCIVAHPVNPPYYVPMVEVVPAPWTSKTTIEVTRAMMKEIGQSPVMFKWEQLGFGLNRLQYIMVNECVRMVESGVLTVDDVDIIMRDGLGYRYAWMGVFETCTLNANGMADYMERYGSSITTVTSSFGPIPSYEKGANKEVVSQLEKLYPNDKLHERVEWRDERLVAIAKLKKEMKELEKPRK